MSFGGAARGAVVLAFAAALGGCSGSSSELGDGGAPFVAFNRDFDGFTSWEHVTFSSEIAAGSTHVGGTRTVYINRKPPAGAVAFPVGTIIVKVTDADGKIFARAKRGGNFNSKNAVGWEWFELEPVKSGWNIAWRGVGPPLGETYGGDPNAGCNLCHKAAAASDYVLTPGLGLEPVGGLDGGTDAVTEADAREGLDAEPDAADDAAHE
jgi:hypothetical protein